MPVSSAARRRDIWEMLPGKNMVLIRSGMSDLFDILTCLCVYAVEAKKMRLKLHNPKLIAFLQKELEKGSRSAASILETLHFSEHEIKSLIDIWGDKAPQKLNDIVRHRERISFNVRRRVVNYNSRRMQIWTKQIGLAAGELLGSMDWQPRAHDER